MGGKNAIIVDDDADLDEAVHGVAHSAFGYQGQKCSACSRAIVIGPLYDQFLARLIEVDRSLKVAPAEDPGCTIGPVIDEEARERILSYVAKGKQEGRLAYAGELGPLETRAVSWRRTSSPTCRRQPPSPRRKSSAPCWP